MASVRPALVLALLAVIPVAAAAADGKISLAAKDLYAGFDARKVMLDEQGNRLALDARVFKRGKSRQGVVVTDPIDLGPTDGIVGLTGTVKSVQVQVAADVPEGATVAVEARSSTNGLDTSNWSRWTKLKGLGGRVEKPAGRYLQVRITLTAAADDRLPALTGLALTAMVQPGRAWAGKLTVADAKIQKIVRSPIEFHYERPDHPKLVKFRKAAKLDEVVAAGKDDFQKLVRLMDWVGSCQNVRSSGRERQGGGYQWDIDKVFEVKPDGTCVVYGHCMSFSEVMVTAATALGYVGSRHMCDIGFRQASHEITDIWVPSLGKWVYFDPSLTNYYFDKKTRAPMNLIEMHLLVAEKFLKPGEDMHWFCERGNTEVKARVRSVGGKAHIGCRLGPSKYGEPMPPDYDWGWRHGYLAAGFVQMTPRNDFHSNPKARPRGFGNNPGYSNYPFWVDRKTPPTRRVSNWFTRLRDFYWTLDQAAFTLVQGPEGTLRVELGQSMPFFKAYQLKVDGAEVKDVTRPFTWKLKPGVNRLQVAPVDEFGKRGLGSSVTVSYTK